MKFYIANMGIIFKIIIRILLKHPVEWKARRFCSWLTWGWKQTFLQGLWEGGFIVQMPTNPYFFLGGGSIVQRGGLACTYVCEDSEPLVLPNLCSTHRLCRKNTKNLKTKAYSWTILSIPIIFFQRFIFLSHISKAHLICFGWGRYEVPYPGILGVKYFRTTPKSSICAHQTSVVSGSTGGLFIAATRYQLFLSVNIP